MIGSLFSSFSPTITDQFSFCNTTFNVAFVYYGAGSYLVNGQRSDHSKDIHWTGWLGFPIVPHETVEASLNLGNGLFYSPNKYIRHYTFNAPPEPFPPPVQKEPMHVARLIATYH